MLGLGGKSPKFCPGPQINTGQLDTVVLLLVDVIGSRVISLSRCCLPNDEGQALQIFFLEPTLVIGAYWQSCQSVIPLMHKVAKG